MIKIAICGHANSGKDRTTSFIEKFYNDYEFAQIAFATPIKEAILKMYPLIPKKYLFGSSSMRKNIIPNSFDSEGNPLTIRKLLQDLGKIFKAYNPNIILDCFDTSYNQVINEINSYKIDNAIITVTDLRFKQELEHLKKKNFFFIKLIRDNIIKLNDISEIEQDSISLSEFNYILYNNSTLDDLEKEIKNNLLPQINNYFN